MFFGAALVKRKKNAVLLGPTSAKHDPCYAWQSAPETVLYMNPIMENIGMEKKLMDTTTGFSV